MQLATVVDSSQVWQLLEGPVSAVSDTLTNWDTSDAVAGQTFCVRPGYDLAQVWGDVTTILQDLIVETVWKALESAWVEDPSHPYTCYPGPDLATRSERSW